jgi:creatinine amidohydrolase
VSPPRAIRWESLNKRQFDAIDRERAVVLLSCSPIEVHGPHLPMGADALEADGLSDRVLRFLPERHADRTFLQLPFIYAATDTVPQPGSLYFQPSTTVRVLTDLGRTLAAQGFRHVIVGNFHGGPRHFLSIEKACRKVQRRHRLGMVSLFSLMISRLTQGTSNLDAVLGSVEGVDPAQLEGDTHGGLVETSQLLALHGDWVDPEYKSLPRQTVDGWLASRGRPHKEKHPKGLPAMIRAFGATQAFFLEETYTGTPAAASAEVGERFLDLLGSKAAEGVTELLDGTLRPEDCHSPIWRSRFVFLNPLMIRVMNRMIGFRNPIA